MELELKARLERGELDETLGLLYGEDLAGARGRCQKVMESFEAAFGRAPEALFSAPGRTELGGNHTDHQHGRVLAAGVNLDILAAAAVNHTGVVRFQSEGYPMIKVDLRELEPKEEERNTSAALSVRRKARKSRAPPWFFPAVRTAAGETTRAALERYPVAGLLYDDTNLVTMEQAKTMLANVQGYSKIPLILTCDEEGGRVNRLMHTIGTTYIGPMLDYKDQGVDKAAENARTIAADLAACGFNMDLAPVADVWSNRANTAIGDRAYSDDFQQAAQLVSAAVGGFHEGGVACTLKHFPGHGDTSADSHYGSVYVYKTLDELRGAELVPFRAGIEAGADAVMLGHLIMADIDEQPALFSHKVVTGLLREELGFGGVVITDSLDMRAITDHYGSGEIAVAAIQAGVDLLLCPQDLDETIGNFVDGITDYVNQTVHDALDDALDDALEH